MHQWQGSVADAAGAAAADTLVDWVLGALEHTRLQVRQIARHKPNAAAVGEVDAVEAAAEATLDLVGIHHTARIVEEVEVAGQNLEAPACPRGGAELRLGPFRLRGSPQMVDVRLNILQEIASGSERRSFGQAASYSAQDLVGNCSQRPPAGCSASLAAPDPRRSQD